MAIAIINALYTFAMAFKGYQIQQIAQYQYEFLAGKIWDTLHVPFNEWERYRREVFAKKRGPEPIRTIYYVLIGSLPTIVSYTIIVLYWYFDWRQQAGYHHWASLRNWFSVGAFMIVTCSLIFSLLTSKLNKRWDQILSEAEAKRGPDVLDKPQHEQEESRKELGTADWKRRYIVALIFAGVFIASTTILLGGVSGVFHPTSDTSTWVAVFTAIVSAIGTISTTIRAWRNDRRDAREKELKIAHLERELEAAREKPAPPIPK